MSTSPEAGASLSADWGGEGLARRTHRRLVYLSAVLAACCIAAQQQGWVGSDLWWLSLLPAAIVAWTGAVIPTVVVVTVCTCAWLVDAFLRGGGWGEHMMTPAAYALLAMCLAAGIVALRRTVVGYDALLRSNGKIGLLPARGFTLVLSVEVERARRYARPFTLLYISVDTTGSLGAWRRSASLRGIAGVLAASVRGPDSVARVGRGDFAVLLPETSASAARLFVERLTGALGDAVATLHDRPHGRGVMIGMVTWVAGGASAELLLQRAYQLMFDASGRGLVLVNHEVIDSSELAVSGAPVPDRRLAEIRAHVGA